MRERRELVHPDEQISGCTAVLVTYREAPANRVVAYNNRGNAHRAKGETDRAIGGRLALWLS